MDRKVRVLLRLLFQCRLYLIYGIYVAHTIAFIAYLPVLGKWLVLALLFLERTDNIIKSLIIRDFNFECELNTS